MLPVHIIKAVSLSLWMNKLLTYSLTYLLIRNYLYMYNFLYFWRRNYIFAKKWFCPCLVNRGLSTWRLGQVAEWPKLSLIFYKYNKNIISLIILLWAANLQGNINAISPRCTMLMNSLSTTLEDFHQKESSEEHCCSELVEYKQPHP